MQKIKTFLAEYFNFGKRDRIGLLCLLGLIILVYALPYLFAKKQNPFSGGRLSVLSKAVDSLSERNDGQSGSGHREADAPRYRSNDLKSEPHGELFSFDPNTLSVEGWQKLGLAEKTARTIEKYRSKGGKFYRPEDIQKIWGVPSWFYERVKDYASIVAHDAYQKRDAFQNNNDRKFEKKTIVVDVNEGDTAAFIALPGIGSKLAQRIVSFREKLGGFFSVEQLRETYGLPDSIFQKIRSSLQLSGEVKKMNVNTATKEELKLHPYIRWNLANAIVEYRNQHGPFKTLDELKNIALVDEASFSRIVHYFHL